MQATVEVETHYFGLRGKFGTFTSSNEEDKNVFLNLFDPMNYTFEFRPDNPNARIVELKKGETVEVAVPGIMWVSNHRQPVTIPFTFSRDRDGRYHMQGNLVLNVNSMNIPMPADLSDKVTGTFRFNFTL
jgi:hypothetical protein